ncbi:hypothetical protein HYY75_06490 [bacterium]|nr:hypothetical protein [bacterium]
MLSDFSNALRGYHALLRGVVEILEIFPPRRLDKEEAVLRKGFYQPITPITGNTVWVHGASLGEIITLRPFLSRISQRFGPEKILATSTTADGLKQLKNENLVGHATFLPIEIPEFVEPFLDRTKPGLVLFSETEIWPLLLAILSRRGIPYGIINARINPRTVKCLKLLRSLFSNGVEGLSFVFPQNRQYAARFNSLGVSKDKIQVLGSFKYDIFPPHFCKSKLREKLGIPIGRAVFCFGSTRSGEESIILDALEPLWSRISATVVIAPRHLERVPEVERLLSDRNIDFTRLSKHKSPTPHVLLVDVLGELRNIFAVSDLAFVGGSLAPFGGHNVMEPAAFSVPVISGPFTENFRSEIQALKGLNALIEVFDRKTLTEALRRFIVSPESFKEYGFRANEVLKRMAGASQRTESMLDKLNLFPKCLLKS